MDKKLAKIIYEMTCGSTSGHMAHVPNNPVLFALFSTLSTSGKDSQYALSMTDFGVVCREISNAILLEEQKF